MSKDREWDECKKSKDREWVECKKCHYITVIDKLTKQCIETEAHIKSMEEVNTTFNTKLSERLEKAEKELQQANELLVKQVEELKERICDEYNPRYVENLQAELDKVKEQLSQEIMKSVEVKKENEALKNEYGQANDISFKMYNELDLKYQALKKENEELKEYKRLHEGESQAHFNAVSELADLKASIENVELPEKKNSKPSTYSITDDKRRYIAEGFNQAIDQCAKVITKRDGEIETINIDKYHIEGNLKIAEREIEDLGFKLKEYTEETSKLKQEHAEEIEVSLIMFNLMRAKKDKSEEELAKKDREINKRDCELEIFKREYGQFQARIHELEDGLHTELLTGSGDTDILVAKLKQRITELYKLLKEERASHCERYNKM